MSHFVGVTEEAERIADSKLSVKYKHIISKSINHTFQLLCIIYAFPISSLSFIPLAADFYGVIIGIGIIFNTMIIIMALHIFNLLSTIKSAEMVFISFWVCMGYFLIYEHFLIPKQRQKEIVKDGSTHSILEIEREEDTEKLSPYEQSIFKWFHSTKSYLGKIPKDRHPHYDGVVFHYVLFAALISITFGYVFDGIMQVFNGDKIITTYSDIYEFIGVVAANIIFGYKIMDFTATWFVKWFWKIDAIKNDNKCKCNCKCNIDISYCSNCDFCNCINCYDICDCAECGKYFCPECRITPNPDCWEYSVCNQCYDDTIIECDICKIKCALLHKSNDWLYPIDGSDGFTQIGNCQHESCDTFICWNCYGIKGAQRVKCTEKACRVWKGFVCWKHTDTITYICHEHKKKK
eukprot:351623_1